MQTLMRSSGGSASSSDLALPSPSREAGARRRHREIDNLRRQREASLLHRLHELSSPASASDWQQDLADADVIELEDDGGVRRRRRVQKADILQRAAEQLENLKQQLSSGDAAVPDLPPLPLLPSRHGMTAGVAGPTLSLWPASESGSSASVSRSPPLPLTLLPLEAHVHRAIAEWLEELYLSTAEPRDSRLLSNIALHWQQVALAPVASDPRSLLASASLAQQTLLSSSSWTARLSTPLRSGSPLSAAVGVEQYRRRAIGWLREAALSAVRGGGRREVTRWLSSAMQLLELLPDARNFGCRLELMRLQRLYCSYYAASVAVTQSLREWATLCELCDELQQRTEDEQCRLRQTRSQPQPEPESEVLSALRTEGLSLDEAAVEMLRSSFYALRGLHLALNANIRSPVDVDATARTAERLLAIATRLQSHEPLVMAHALYVRAIEAIYRGRYHSAIEDGRQAWQLCLSRPFVLNPLAPHDPGVGGLMCAGNALALCGRLSEAMEHMDRAAVQAQQNAEPVTLQWALGMRTFCLSQLGEFGPGHAAAYSAYWELLRESEHLSTSSPLYDAVHSLYEARSSCTAQTPAACEQTLQRLWLRYGAGDSWIVAFSSPLCELLWLAGQWQRGLRLVDDWQRLSQRGRLSFYYPDALRFKAMFLLQQAAAADGADSQANPEGDERCSWQFSATQAAAQADSEAGDAAALPAELDTLDDLGRLSSFLFLPVEQSGSDTAYHTTPAPSSPIAPPAPHPQQSEALQLLRDAVALARQLGVRLLELKALMELVPLLRRIEHSVSGSPAVDTGQPPCCRSLPGSPLFSPQLSLRPPSPCPPAAASVGELQQYEGRLLQLLTQIEDEERSRGSSTTAFSLLQHAHLVLGMATPAPLQL